MSATETQTIKSDYADTLNSLHDMQGSMYYAARRTVLRRAEQIIVDLEAENKRLKEKLNE